MCMGLSKSVKLIVETKESYLNDLPVMQTPYSFYMIRNLKLCEVTITLIWCSHFSFQTFNHPRDKRYFQFILKFQSKFIQILRIFVNKCSFSKLVKTYPIKMTFRPSNHKSSNLLHFISLKEISTLISYIYPSIALKTADYRERLQRLFFSKTSRNVKQSQVII